MDGHSGKQSSGKDTQHHLPAGDTGEQEKRRADKYAQGGGFAERSGDQSEECVPVADRIAHDIMDFERTSGMGGHLSERRGARYAVGEVDRPSKPADRAGGDERPVAAHACRIGEEQKRTCHQRHIEDIVACAAEYLLDEYHREGRGHSHHPQRRFDRTYQRDQDAGDEESFLDLLMTPLRHDKLYAESHQIGDHDLRQDCQKTVGHQLPERKIGMTRPEIILIAAIIHAKQQTRQQSHHHNDHHTFRVESVVDMHATPRGVARRIEECIHSIKHAMQRLKPSARLKMRTCTVEILLYQ